MIYSFARSLDVNLVFDDRPYELGEIIIVTVELNARRDVNVREGHVYLVYDVRWTAPDTELQPLRLTRPSPGGRTITFSTLTVPTRKRVEQRKSYVLGGSSFLKPTPLDSHTSVSYNIKLEIHNDDPPYAFVEGASTRWSLAAAIDVARTLDIKISRDVKIMLRP